MIMLRHVPIRLRLTLWYVVLLAIILAVFIASVYLLLRQSLYRNLDESMLNQANALLDVIQYEGDRPFLPSEVSEMDRSQDEDFVRLFDASGNLLEFDNSAALEQGAIYAEVVANTLQGESITRSVKIGEDDDSMRVITLPIIRDEDIVGVLEVGQSEEDVSDTLNSLLYVMMLAYPIALLAATSMECS
jgi:two-component system, OmpR family, sensor kinase